jgi:hypothetical protein
MINIIGIKHPPMHPSSSILFPPVEFNEFPAHDFYFLKPVDNLRPYFFGREFFFFEAPKRLYSVIL